MPNSAQQRASILEALARVMAWPELARSPQLGKFLEHIVRLTIDGQPNSIKAYAIAVDVFGRNADFDPQTDPIVRVQARRLRALLKQYYSTAGADDPLQIRLPVGRYVPEFVTVERAVPLAPDSAPVTAPVAQLPRMLGSWLILAAGTICLALVAYLTASWTEPPPPLASPMKKPSIVIAEFVQQASSGSALPPVSGLAVELVTDLEQFEDVDVQYGGGELAPILTTQESRNTFLLSGIVRPAGEDFEYDVTLMDRLTGKSVWTDKVVVRHADIHTENVLDFVSREIALVLASPRGPLHAVARALVQTGHTFEAPTTLYMCRMIFSVHRDAANERYASRVRQCLADLPSVDASSAIALAMTGSLAADMVERANGANTGSDYQDAISALNRALLLSSVSAFVWEQHAHLREAMGEYAVALTDYGSALQLNPASTDILAAYGRLLVFSGALSEARPLLVSAMASEPSPPDWFAGGPAVLALVDEDHGGALQLAERYVNADREVGSVISLVAGYRAGDAIAVGHHMSEVLQTQSFKAHGIMRRVETKIIDPDLLDLIGRGLIAAGVPEAALQEPF